MKALERDATETSIVVIDLYKSNLTKLKGLGFSCLKEDKAFLNCPNYIISWE